MTKKHTQEFWFTGKRPGFGWGSPATWQGWLVLLSFLGLVILTGKSDLSSPIKWPLISLATFIFFAIYYIKGDKPKSAFNRK